MQAGGCFTPCGLGSVPPRKLLKTSKSKDYATSIHELKQPNSFPFLPMHNYNLHLNSLT